MLPCRVRLGGLIDEKSLQNAGNTTKKRRAASFRFLPKFLQNTPSKTGEHRFGGIGSSSNNLPPV